VYVRVCVCVYVCVCVVLANCLCAGVTYSRKRVPYIIQRCPKEGIDPLPIDIQVIVDWEQVRAPQLHNEAPFCWVCSLSSQSRGIHLTEL